MNELTVVASITSPPTSVMLKLNGVQINIARDGSGAWKGTATMSLPTTFPLEFRGVGIAGAMWSLSITFSSTPPQPLKNYKHDGVISENLMSVWQDTVTP